MAVLIRPKRWNAVPPPGAVVDLSHPLGKDMRIGWVFVNSTSGATGGFNMPSVPGAESQATWAITASLPNAGNGLFPTGLRLTGTTGDTGQPQFTTLAPARCLVGGGTVMFKGRFLGNALRSGVDGTVRLWGVDPHSTDTSPFSGIGLMRTGTALSASFSNVSANISYSGLSSTDYGKPVQAIATAGARGSALYVGPTLVASSSVDASITGLGPSDATLRMGGWAGTSGFKINAEYEAVWLWGRVLNGDEVAWLAAEPYAMLQPAKPQSRILTTGLRLGVNRRAKPWGSQKPPVGAQVNWDHPLAQGLAGAWLNRDAVVNAITGELAVRSSPAAGGHQDGGISFPAVPKAGAVQLKNGTILSGSSSFTVMVLARVVAGSATYCERGATGNGLIKIDTTSPANIPQFNYRNDAGTLLQISGGTDMTTYPRGEYPWHVVIAVKNGTAVTLWQNGVQVASGTWSGANDTLTATSMVTRLGSDPAASSATAVGSISTTAVWNRALSKDEILKLYSEPHAFMQSPTRWQPTSQLDFPDPLPLPQQGIIGGWWKADAITPQADNSALTSWPTSAGAAGAAATSGSTPPTYRTASGPNRMPCVDFDGSGQRMLTAGNLGIVTMFVVAKARTDATAAGRIIDSPGSFRTLIQVNSSTNGRLSVFEAPGTFGTANPNVSRDLRDSWHIFTAQFGSVLRVWVDGILEYNNNVTGFSGNFNQLIFGSDSAGSNLKGSIAEVLVYIGGMVDGDRDTVNSILAAKYSLPMSYSRLGNYRDLTHQAVQRAAVI